MSARTPTVIAAAGRRAARSGGVFQRLNARSPRLGVIALVLALAAGACGVGERPTLVPVTGDELDPIAVVDALELEPAPPGVQTLEGAPATLPLEASVDDALASWASANGVAYLDNCALVTPGPGQLCDRPTERDTVRLLGPSEDETWYVVIVHEEVDDSIGRGFRVDAVNIPGR